MAAERALLDSGKRLAIALLTEAAAGYGQGVKEEQEVLADIADVIIDLYAVESATGRAEKIVAARGADAAAVALDMTRAFAADASDRMTRSARQVARALAAKARGSSIANLCRPLAAYEAIDGVSARRRIAEAVVAAGKHPV